MRVEVPLAEGSVWGFKGLGLWGFEGFRFRGLGVRGKGFKAMELCYSVLWSCSRVLRKVV